MLHADGAIRRRDLIMGGCLLTAALAARLAEPHHELVALPHQKLQDVVPRAFDTWHEVTGPEIVFPTEVQDAQKTLYNDVLMRSYQSEDTVVMFVVAYDRAQTGMLQLHRPESCYPAQGLSLSTPSPVNLETRARPIASTFQTATSHDHSRVEQLLYWTRIGGHFPLTFDQQRMAVIQENLAGNAPDGVLVRMSTLVADPAEGLKTLTGFAKSLLFTAGEAATALYTGPKGSGM